MLCGLKKIPVIIASQFWKLQLFFSHHLLHLQSGSFCCAIDSCKWFIKTNLDFFRVIFEISMQTVQKSLDETWKIAFSFYSLQNFSLKQPVQCCLDITEILRNNWRSKWSYFRISNITILDLCSWFIRQTLGLFGVLFDFSVKTGKIGPKSFALSGKSLFFSFHSCISF